MPIGKKVIDKTLYFESNKGNIRFSVYAKAGLIEHL